MTDKHPTAPESPQRSRWDVQPSPFPALATFTALWLGGSLVGVISGIVILSGEKVTDRRLIVAVFLAGAGGAGIQATTSLASYVGNRVFRSSWTLWYLLRPLLGGVFALLIYVVLRASLIGSSVPASKLNYYGVLALSAVAGLFTRSAVDKLVQVFDVLVGEQPILTRAGVPTEVGPPKPVRQLDRFRGFVIHELRLSNDPARWELRLWLQPAPHDTLSSTEIDIGEGPPVTLTTFRVTTYSDMCDVQPMDTELTVPEGLISDVLTVSLVCPPGVTEPSGIVELSQFGRTVAVIGLQPAESG